MDAGRRWFLAAIVLAAGWTPASAGQPLKLGSGNSVEILAVGPLKSTQGWSALALRYRTQIPLNDLAALRKEADEIWDRLVVDVERGGYQSAVISANEPETGVGITTNKSYNFVFEKQNGSWRTFETKEREQAKLDLAFMKEFIARLDWAFEYNHMNTLLLYMADNWTMTVSNPADVKTDPQVLDRMRFVAESHAAFTAAKSRRHDREILEITLSDDRLNAEVTSRETEEITINDRTIAGSEKTKDIFQLKGNILLWSNSSSVVEKRTDTKAN